MVLDYAFLAVSNPPDNILINFELNHVQNMAEKRHTRTLVRTNSSLSTRTSTALPMIRRQKISYLNHPVTSQMSVMSSLACWVFVSRVYCPVCSCSRDTDVHWLLLAVLSVSLYDGYVNVFVQALVCHPIPVVHVTYITATILQRHINLHCL